MLIIFFPGWPKMAGLLMYFIHLLRKNCAVIVYDEKNDLNFSYLKEIYNEEIYGLGYSAGVKKLLAVDKSHPGFFKKNIFFAPLGVVPYVFFGLGHYYRFCKEILRNLFSTNYWPTLKIVMECLGLFFFNFLRSIKEVNRISRFHLKKELRDHKTPTSIISPGRDVFLPLRDEIEGVKIINAPLLGHFSIVFDPMLIVRLIYSEI